MRKRAKSAGLPTRCASHKPFVLSYSAAHGDADERIERGEHQEQCAVCKRWFWAHQQGGGFVSTGRSDVTNKIER